MPKKTDIREKLKKHLENQDFMKKIQASADRRRKKPHTGGLLTKKSRCCGAPVITVGQGLLREICSQCKKPYRPGELKK
jgi:hypothetical protein